ALHTRSYKKHGYTTIAEHMPQGHQIYQEQKGWDAGYFLSQAVKIGPSASLYIQTMLNSKRFTEQTYNACLSLLRLSRSYGNESCMGWPAATRPCWNSRCTNSPSLIYS